MQAILTYLKTIFRTSKKEDKEQLKGYAGVDELLQSLITDKKVPGVSITVLKKGKTVFQRGYGFADIDAETPVNPEKTIYRIASVSKPIVATALAKMVEDGTIDLDASFYEYVPYYPKKKWDFTIRQLASHTAGIRGYKGLEYGLNKPYSIKEGIAIFKDDALLFKPSTDYLYNSYDWVLVSLAMQEASGIPFEDYVRKNVLEPMGLSNTFAEVSTALDQTEEVENNQGEDLIHHIAKFYSKNRFGFREAIPVNNFYKLAGGGYLSTSTDVAKLGQAYLNGNLFKKETLQEFLTSQSVNSKPTYYGLGWQVSQDLKGRSFYGHIGNGVGGYSNFFIYPQQEIVISILINCTNPKIQDVLDATVNEIITSFNIPA